MRKLTYALKKNNSYTLDIWQLKIFELRDLKWHVRIIQKIPEQFIGSGRMKLWVFHLIAFRMSILNFIQRIFIPCFLSPCQYFIGLMWLFYSLYFLSRCVYVCVGFKCLYTHVPIEVRSQCHMSLVYRGRIITWSSLAGQQGPGVPLSASSAQEL